MRKNLGRRTRCFCQCSYQELFWKGGEVEVAEAEEEVGLTLDIPEPVPTQPIFSLEPEPEAAAASADAATTLQVQQTQKPISRHQAAILEAKDAELFAVQKHSEVAKTQILK